MMKNMLIASFIGAMLLFSGCSNTDGEDRLEIQQMLDSGDYAGVISALEASSEANTTDISENMTLGSAYMGAAGLSSIQMFAMVADTSTITSATAAPSLKSTRVTDGTVDNDAFARFAEEIQKNAEENPRVMELLEKAITMFKRVEAEAPGNKADAKLFLGLSQFAKATTTFTYLGDVATLISDGADEELMASACAIAYVYAPGLEDNLTDCSVVVPVANNEATDATLYKEIKVTLSDARGDYRRLLTADSASLVITNNYTSLVDGNETNSSGGGTYSARPVQDETLTIESALLTALNEGFDLIIEIAPADIIDEINDFKSEINTDGDAIITAEELASYIDVTINGL